jgi:hypothetical protein
MNLFTGLNNRPHANPIFCTNKQDKAQRSQQQRRPIHSNYNYYSCTDSDGWNPFVSGEDEVTHSVAQLLGLVRHEELHGVVSAQAGRQLFPVLKLVENVKPPLHTSSDDTMTASEFVPSSMDDRGKCSPNLFRAAWTTGGKCSEMDATTVHKVLPASPFSLICLPGLF